MEGLMDVTCSKCKEPWDIYGLAHDEEIFTDPGTAKKGYVVGEPYEKGGFVYLAPDGLEEAKEGTVMILACPSCDSSEGPVVPDAGDDDPDEADFS